MLDCERDTKSSWECYYIVINHYTVFLNTSALTVLLTTFLLYLCYETQ